MKLKNKEILKYASYEIATMIVCGQSLKFNNPEFFNDPFDCDINLLDFEIKEVSEEVQSEILMLKNSIPYEISDELLREAYEASQKDKIKRSSICCFSMRYDMPTMWSHYADHHNGIALVFDYAIDQPFESISNEDLTSFSVDYDNYTKLNYCASKSNGIKKLFGTKSWEWKYESEYRIILLNNSGLIKFNKSFLTGVIFGLRVNEKDIERFISICNNNGYDNLRFSKMKKEGLKFQIEEINLV